MLQDCSTSQVLWCHAAARSAKAAKHKAVFVLASAKLNIVHSHISKALEDCNIFDDEYKFVIEEIEKYRTMKETMV